MRALLFALALTSVSLGYRPAAEACMNETLYTLHDATRQLADAEALLERGRYAQALRKARKVPVKTAADHYGRSLEIPKPANWRALLEARKQRVIATAQLRLGNAEKARPALAALVQQAPDDPGLQARYAEALLATGDHAVGSTILVDLQTRDLMPDAAAWVALANEHDRSGDVAARDRAVAGCTAIATKAADCTLRSQAKATKTKAKTKAKATKTATTAKTTAKS